MAAVTVRRGEPADRAGIAVVFRRASLHNDGDREVLAAHPEVLEWDGQIDDGLVVAVVPSGQVVGFARVVDGVAPDAAELEDLFVDPSWMRHGIATQLIARLVDVVVGRGGVRMDVVANEAARAFYRSAGFVDAGRATTRFGSAPRMTRDLVAHPP
jgi:GNAT superfamily N-acetyltransferase